MKFFGEVFVTLLVITDPAGTVPMFIALTRRSDRRERHRLAWQAALVALGEIVAFALFGREVLDYLGVSCRPCRSPAAAAAVAARLLTGKA